MKSGLIYSIVDYIVENLQRLNLVELFKWAAKRLYPSNEIVALRLGVDIFILLKWLTVIVFWINQVTSKFASLILWYLILTNLYTYFYHHTWTKDLYKENFTLDRVKRRFIYLLLAILFNIFSFAYLIRHPFSENYEWANQIATTKNALLISVANSLAICFDSVTATTQFGQALNITETATMFVFLTIILSNSIPQIKIN